MILSSGWNVELVGWVGSDGSGTFRARDLEFVCRQVVYNKLIQNINRRRVKEDRKRKRSEVRTLEDCLHFRKGKRKGWRLRCVQRIRRQRIIEANRGIAFFQGWHYFLNMEIITLDRQTISCRISFSFLIIVLPLLTPVSYFLGPIYNSLSLSPESLQIENIERAYKIQVYKIYTILDN